MLAEKAGARVEWVRVGRQRSSGQGDGEPDADEVVESAARVSVAGALWWRAGDESEKEKECSRESLWRWERLMVRPRPPPCCGAIYDLAFGLASASVCETVPAPRGGDCGEGRKVKGGRLRLWRMAVGGPLATMPHACCRPRPAAGRMSFCDDPNRGYAPESLSCHVELLSYDTLL